jgi:hypothetical protein
MSRILRSRNDLRAYVKAEVAKGEDPWLTISEVSVLVDFHRRTLQRFVDEGVLAHERRGPTKRVFIPWSVVKKEWPQDTRGV